MAVATLARLDSLTEFGDIQGVMARVFPSVREIVRVDELVKCFPYTTGLCKWVYGEKYGPQCHLPRKKVLAEQAWSIVENIPQPVLYDRESRIAECAHGLCYTHLLVQDVLRQNARKNAIETEVLSEVLRDASNMLHIGVPLGLLPKMPHHTLALYIF
ncbi:MAG: hypothetical protein A3C02_02660 [Candidatus Andersenbacteria bacterium RIFCSPHIGHO2_02_FULL_45_11]|uniref:Uncharacterized protein n=1 Tax=Candidatus Andersenbacteria bacterium RIFCSPHIGHO2_12_FULL_45_11 TaxID=1797281 RepID=A0A1G1X665_9BACT|nr:MAG: hypothetical protein A3C02_02660 [Candidatus Andersenbacteria bacterium RIFCSPHIGHO2_02_FULL_45_11]OGY35271.1 MAG: hypothetical protein A3D99_01220 [Candidatus Andersenbacteria bacterium RIFCSPHIGHO2_12_FULL_45_11]